MCPYVSCYSQYIKNQKSKRITYFVFKTSTKDFFSSVLNPNKQRITLYQQANESHKCSGGDRTNSLNKEYKNII